MMSARPAHATSDATAMIAFRSIEARSGRRLEHHGRSVSDDFTHRLSDLGGIESHHHDRVRLHECRIAHHAVDGVATSLLEQLCVFADLPADDGAQSGHDVAAQTAAPHHHAEDLALHFAYPVAGHILGRHDKHETSSSVLFAGRVCLPCD